MSYRRNDSLSSGVINELKRVGRSCSTLELARALGMNRKDINPTLYSMKSQNLLQKVQETPPRWQLTQGGVMQGVSGAHGRGRGRGRGRAKGAPPTSSPPGYKFPANPQYEFPSSSSANLGFGRGRGRTPIPTSNTTGTQSMTHFNQPPLRTRLQEALLKASKPLTALELAKQLDFSSRSSVNPDLYAMEKEGAVCRHQPDPNSAPVWFLPRRTMGSASQPSPSGVSSASPVARGGQAMETDVAVSRGGSTLSSPQKQNIGYKSQSSEEDVMETEESALSHISEDNIEERLLAVLRLGGPSSKKTELDLSHGISSESRAFSRSEIRPHLASLEQKGILQKKEGMPVTWRLNDDPPPTGGIFYPLTGGSSSPTARGGASPQKVS